MTAAQNGVEVLTHLTVRTCARSVPTSRGRAARCCSTCTQTVNSGSSHAQANCALTNPVLSSAPSAQAANTSHQFSVSTVWFCSRKCRCVHHSPDVLHVQGGMAAAACVQHSCSSVLRRAPMAEAGATQAQHHTLPRGVQCDDSHPDMVRSAVAQHESNRLSPVLQHFAVEQGLQVVDVDQGPEPRGPWGRIPGGHGLLRHLPKPRLRGDAAGRRGPEVHGGGGLRAVRSVPPCGGRATTSPDPGEAPSTPRIRRTTSTALWTPHSAAASPESQAAKRLGSLSPLSQ